MKPLVLTPQMEEAAKSLNEGPILFSYLDEGRIRMETERGRDPYVWRDNTWIRMRRSALLRRQAG